MNYSLNNNLLCEKRIQKCLHDFSMNEVIDIIRESKLIKFTDKNYSYNKENKILYGLDLSKLKKNLSLLTYEGQGIIYDINLKLDTNSFTTVFNDNNELVKNYFKHDDFKIQTEHSGYYQFFCKPQEMDEKYNPYLDDSKISVFANIIKTRENEYYIESDIILNKHYKYVYLAGRVVEDFTSIDTKQLLVLQNSTIQHLLTENNSMKKNINILQSTNDSLTYRLETLEANILKFMNSN